MLRTWIAGTAMALFALAFEVRAQDWYVDAAAGSNANAGTSPAQAWKTITWAVGHVPSGGATQRIHIAPGTYDAALGEAATISLGDAQQLLGSGIGATVFRSTSLALAISHYAALPYPSITNRTRVEGMSVQGAQQGLWIGSSWGTVEPVISDVEFSGSSLQGVIVNTGAVGYVAPRFDRVRCTGNSVGLTLGVSAPSFFDCTFDANLQDGIGIQPWSGLALASFARCRSERNGGRGIRAVATNGSFHVTFVDGSSSLNAGGGFDSSRVAGYTASATFHRSTIAHNGGSGVALSDTEAGTSLVSSIVYGNSDDLAYGASFTVDHCDIGDGDFAGANGNFSADPSFVAAAAGDLRLRWGSPCIESANPAVPSGVLDLAGLKRPIDGDLDTNELPDVGAFEFAPLFHAGPAQSGGALVLECWGPSGSATQVYFSRRPLAAVPQSTPFGDFDLDPASFGPFKTALAAPGPPGLVQRSIPPSPELVGRTFCFQARISSPAAPNGAAYSNPIVVTIVP